MPETEPERATEPASAPDTAPDTAPGAGEHTLSGAELAAAYGLVKVGGRPPLGEYLRTLWQRRHFAITLARSKAYARNQLSYLGQLWNILTPVLWASVYLFVFGFLLSTDQGVANYPAFLVVGVFLFRFNSSAMTTGGRAIIGNESLITSLQFPRALLPAATVLSELFTLLPAIGVLLVIVTLTGETPDWQWLLLPVAVLMQWVFSTGVALTVARLVAEVRDVTNLIPFVIRALMYVSGVFFSIDHYAGDGPIGHVLAYQPVAVYIDLGRAAMLHEVPIEGSMWLAGALWALAFLVLGFLFFWRGEEKYGRG